MPGFLFHKGGLAICPHGGQVQVQTANVRVKVMGMPVATVNDLYTVVGCGFTVPPGKPQPCVVVQGLVPSTRIRIMGQPVVLQTSQGLARSVEQIPQGPSTVTSTQTRVGGI